ncbi:hypothetical protein B484DRAFT_97675 [Ochromonadaceae sp. CCMP2298]|nr:hypothetical protein B484DRAFT_97675 [Ochromonadaceae sp. CCMP2298]
MESGDIVRFTLQISHPPALPTPGPGGGGVGGGKFRRGSLTEGLKKDVNFSRKELRKHSGSVTYFQVLTCLVDEEMPQNPSLLDVGLNYPSHRPLWALFSASDDMSVIMWAVDSGIPLRVFEGHSDAISAIALHCPSPSILDIILISGSYDGTLKTW